MRKYLAFVSAAVALGFGSAYAAAPQAIVKAAEFCCAVLASCCTVGSCC